MNYWLMKSEPNEYSIDDLAAEAKGYEHWDGVRNYQARNFMRQMKVGDQVFFYHSNTKVPGIVGIAEVVREAYPDHTQFDPENSHYDPKSKPENPRWDMVDIKFVRKLDRIIPLGGWKNSGSRSVSCPKWVTWIFILTGLTSATRITGLSRAVAGP